MKPIRKRWYVGFIMGKTGNKTIAKMDKFFPKIECWMPTYQTLGFSGGQVEVKKELLLENYIFLKMPENSHQLQREIIQKTPVVYFLKDSQGFGFHLSDADILHLQCLQMLTIVPEREVEVGKEVEIKKGAYAGYRGTCTDILGGFAIVKINLHDIQMRAMRFDLSELKLANSVGHIDIMPEMGEYSYGNGKR